MIVGVRREDWFREEYVRDADGELILKDGKGQVVQGEKYASAGDVVVLTWSQSQANAEKGCRDGYRRSIFDMHVEEINGGVRQAEVA